MRPYFVDSHCHVHSLPEDPQTVFSQAKEAGVQRFLNIFELSEWEKSAPICFPPEVWFAVGVHPTRVQATSLHDAEQRLELLCKTDSRIVALGETGIDLHYGSDFPRQLSFLKMHALLCEKYNKALVIHSRKAPLQQILDAIPTNVRFIFHCFSEGPVEAHKIMARGGYLSYSGLTTFGRNVDYIEQAAKETSAHLLLAETDTPYLAPHPHRGKPNRPSYVAYVYERLSHLRQENIALLTQQIACNFCIAFNLPILESL